MAKKTFELEFYGAVSLKEWILCPDGQARKQVVGNVRLLEASTVAGFKLGDREANWVARVENGDGSESMNILGCQIMGIFQGNTGLPKNTTLAQWVM